MRWAGLFYLAGLAGLTALSGWILLAVESSLSQPGTPAPDAPNLYMSRVEAVRMNDRGLREYTLTAAELMQLPGSGGTHLKQPVLELFRNGLDRLWRVQAERGWVSQDQNLIRLEDNVVLNRTAAGQTPLTITTSLLVAVPQQSYVQTDAPARLVTPTGVADSVGVRVHLDEQRLELLSQVRGRYEMPNPPSDRAPSGLSTP
ncbi:MAG: LPS export ABC transporter periplasmic protein LptC [Candidatus Competibacteraceae bacterium]|nr:LPS export ABC transporter periplasmic protein LptC [Candidatus Competibacteraceae bacterium]